MTGADGSILTDGDHSNPGPVGSQKVSDFMADAAGSMLTILVPLTWQIVSGSMAGAAGSILTNNDHSHSGPVGLTGSV